MTYSDRERLRAKVVHLCKEGKLTKHGRNLSVAGTAKELRISRSLVTKLLDEATRLGEIETRVNMPRVLGLQNKLIDKYNLEDCVVVMVGVPLSGTAEPDEEKELCINHIARAGAGYLRKLIRRSKGSVSVGLSGGETLQRLVMEIEPIPEMECELKVFPLSVSKGTKYVDVSPDTCVGILVARLSPRERQTEVSGFSFNAPSLFPSEDDKKSCLQNNPVIRDLFNQALNVDYCVVGCGDLSEGSRMYNALKAGDIDVDSLKEVGGAVGDIADQFFDEKGNPVTFDNLNKRIIAVPLEKLREKANSRHHRVIMVAGGTERKAKALRSALNHQDGPAFDTLITDTRTAERLAADPTS